MRLILAITAIKSTLNLSYSQEQPSRVVSVSAPHAALEDVVDIVMSYQTRSTVQAKGGEMLMLRVATALQEAGYSTFNGLQVGNLCWHHCCHHGLWLGTGRWGLARMVVQQGSIVSDRHSDSVPQLLHVTSVP